MIRILAIFMLIFLGSVPLARAGNKTEPPVQGNVGAGMEKYTLLLEKLRQHPEVQAYIRRAESAQFNAEGELGLPDPMVFIQEQDYPIGSSMSGNQQQEMIGFRQSIPAFGTRDERSDRLIIESRKTGLLGDFAYAAMKARLIATLANLQRIREQKEILAQQIALYGSEKMSLQGRVTANLASQSRIFLNEADRTDIELGQADLEEEEHEAMTMLLNMVGEMPDLPPFIIDRVVWDQDVAKTYPVQIGMQNIEMARKDVALRESAFNPDFEVQANYSRMDGGDNAGTVMVGVSIPLWAARNQQPKLSGAKSELFAVETDQENIKRQVFQNLSHLQAQIKASETRIDLLERKESLLKASGRAQTREYESGKGDFMTPLQTQRDLLSVRYQRAAEQAKHTAFIADFNHYFIEGK